MNYISLVDYNKLYEYGDEPSFSQLFEAFSLHTLTSLSLMLDREVEVYKEGIRETVFDDEVFAKDKIDISHIQGIILPSHIMNKQLSEVSFLPGDAYCYTEKSINHLMDGIENYFKKKVDRTVLLESVKQAWNICYETFEKERYGVDMRDVLASIMENLWREKTKIDNPKYIDILNYINHDRYPIYEINSKKLVRKN